MRDTSIKKFRGIAKLIRNGHWPEAGMELSSDEHCGYCQEYSTVVGEYSSRRDCTNCPVLRLSPKYLETTVVAQRQPVCTALTVFWDLEEAIARESKQEALMAVKNVIGFIETTLYEESLKPATDEDRIIYSSGIDLEFKEKENDR